jgi:hypothetical protein
MNSENRPALSGLPGEGVATTSCIAGEFTKSLIGRVKFRRSPTQAMILDLIKVALKKNLWSRDKRFGDTQIRQKGSQKDRKRHRQSDKLRRSMTELRCEFP